MADSKYGRLYTERDVRRMMSVVAAETTHYAVEMQQRGGDWQGPQSVQEAEAVCDRLLAEDAASGNLAFPADEPLFLLRGQDKAAPDTIATYWEICMGYGDPIAEDQCPEEHCHAVQAAGVALSAWQTEHPDRVKVPGT